MRHGFYEQVISEKIQRELEKIPAVQKDVAAIDPAEASQILAQYMNEVLQKTFRKMISKKNSLASSIDLANRIIQLVDDETRDGEFTSSAIHEEAKQLLTLLHEEDPVLIAGKTAKDVQRPETSLAQSSLFTGAMHEPQMFLELKKEIQSSDAIDMLVSFIKWSGLRLIIDELVAFTQRGGKLRVITTSYMGATDLKAIDELNDLANAQVKISYDTQRTRLHAKAYVFYRDTGFTTAYIGSSNLSNAAIMSGLEWNIKVTAQDLPSTIHKVKATFDSYWSQTEFECYQMTQRQRLMQALKVERGGEKNARLEFFFDLRPYAYQQEILDQLAAERTVRHHYRNLVVAATGTGKTVIAAFDYRRFCQDRGQRTKRLLFVAHREEILKQSLAVFQTIMKNENFGDLFVGSYTPQSIEHLFVSIQTLNSQKLCDQISARFYDYIIIDEFHHAAAPTYQQLLSHFEPQVLLGLTATPERMDGQSILGHFDDRIAAEIRLPEAIDRKLLCPFQYFGVTDTVDLKSMRWARGGYDQAQLSHLYTFSRGIADRRAGHVIHSIHRYVTDMATVKGLGFCVSVEHANFMAEFFCAHDIPSLALVAQSDSTTRHEAKSKLASGKLRFIFVVDIYNEGVDIPEVNTILFLRPTESLTIFLQQLGRGLRLAEDKECLTVLDFIGQAHPKYRFDEKYAALLSHTKNSVEHELKSGFTAVPKGCCIQLEKKAAQHILENIRKAFSTKAGLVRKIAEFAEDREQSLELASFLRQYHIDLKTIYRKHSFFRLCVMAKAKSDFDEPIETILTQAYRRIISIDSRRWIEFLLRFLPDMTMSSVSRLSGVEKRMLHMLYVTVWQKTVKSWQDEEVTANLKMLANSPVMREELLQILKLKHDQIDFIDEPLDLPFACPLDLHCTYSRDQILVALDFMKPSQIREGVKWLPDKQMDVLFITLHKSDKDYSPTTMYNDYSISEKLFHWQSQSTTSDLSPTGQRYIHHHERNSHVLLCVREFKQEAGVAAAYTVFGLARYVKHEGSRPMNIVWHLDRPIPAKFIKKTSRLISG